MRVSRQGMERNQKRLGAESYKQESIGYDSCRIKVARQECRQLGEIQRVRLGIEHYGASQDAGGADAANHKILESRLERTEHFVPECS